MTRDLDLPSLEPFFDTVARLGVRRVKVAGIAPDHGVVTDKMAAVCERLCPLGIVADIEFMMWSSVQTIQDAERIVAATCRDNAGILVDALHLSRSGVSAADVKGIPADRFGYVHIFDAPAALPPDISAMLNEARTMREFPGEGELPLVPLLRALPAGLTVRVELGMHNRGFDADTRVRLGAEATRRTIALADEAA